ncbi:hypothetical protein Sjap_001984 [Stephania japonica]|uniref:Uncharacterized protein n=1 Tax=Stephania japonica TaxID=461633 RepID=A0AAP0KMS4_9MAGN
MSCLNASLRICYETSPFSKRPGSRFRYRVLTTALPVTPIRVAVERSISSHPSFRRREFKSCQAKEDDSESALGSDGIILDKNALERDLEKAIEEENYARAAKIRDSLRFLHEDSKTSVLAANAMFYDLFRHGDLAGMQALWAKGDHVCCVHPGVSGISGYDLVMGSWEFVCAEYEFPIEIELKNIEVYVKGDVGYVTCIEVVKSKGSNWGKQFATNMFERIDGRWYICSHHASYIDL